MQPGSIHHSPEGRFVLLTIIIAPIIPAIIPTSGMANSGTSAVEEVLRTPHSLGEATLREEVVSWAGQE